MPRSRLLLLFVRYRIALLLTLQQIKFALLFIDQVYNRIAVVRNVLTICCAALLQCQDRVTVVVRQIQNCIAV
jgi:hypothetical protein